MAHLISLRPIRHFARSVTTVLVLLMIWVPNVQAVHPDQAVEELVCRSVMAGRWIPIAERLRGLSNHSQVYWQKYAADFHVNAQANAQHNLERYRSAKKAGHAHILFLEDLGFRFEPDLFIPELGAIFTELEFRAVQSRNEKNLFQHTRMFPVVELEINSAGRATAALPFASEIPPSTTFAPYYSPISSENDFYHVISLNQFPFGTADQVNGSRGSFLSAIEHDLGHLGAMLDDRHPAQTEEYTRAFMNSIDRHLKTDDGLRTPAARLDYSNNHWLRIFVASETLAIVKAEKIPQLGLYLSIPQTWVTQSSLISKKELRERLEPLSSDQLVNLGRKLLDEQWANILPMGGALRDLASIDAYFEKNWFQFPVVRLTADLQNGYDRESILRAIATYQQYVLSLARVNTAELMEASFNPVLTPNTRAWEVFCTSGLIKPCGSIFE